MPPRDLWIRYTKNCPKNEKGYPTISFIDWIKENKKIKGNKKE